MHSAESTVHSAYSIWCMVRRARCIVGEDEGQVSSNLLQLLKFTIAGWPCSQMSDHPSLAKVTKCLQPDFSLSTFSLLCFSLSALIEEVVGWGEEGST